MEQQTKELKKLLEESEKILITSHISPDPDAISSVLLLGTVLQHNFPDKEVVMTLEEKPARDLSFLSNYNELKFEPLLELAKKFQPHLFIMLDAMNFERCSRTDGAELRTLINKGAKTAIIDHHTETGKDEADIYINDQLPATAQQIYLLLFDELNLQKTDGYAQTALLGIISDTARFKYDNPAHRQTFKVVSELLDAGASIEALENRMERYSKPQMLALANLVQNMTDSGNGYSYSFIDDDLAQQYTDDPAFKSACELFTSQFIRNFESNQWGFLVYREDTGATPAYSVSFRSVSGLKDVAETAGKLGGGGHKQAAGAKNIKAANVNEAIEIVEQAI